MQQWLYHILYVIRTLWVHYAHAAANKNWRYSKYAKVARVHYFLYNCTPRNFETSRSTYRASASSKVHSSHPLSSCTLTHQNLSARALFCHNRGFARRGTHLYAHDFVPPPSFLFVWRSIKKNNKKRLNFWFTSQNDLKFPPSACANILVILL